MTGKEIESISRRVVYNCLNMGLRGTYVKCRGRKNAISNPMMATMLWLSEKHSFVTFPAIEQTSVPTLLVTRNLFKNLLLCVWRGEEN